MCEIIEFPVKKTKKKPYKSKGCKRTSKILFFYGVRYSRVTHAEQATPKADDLVIS